MSQPSPSPNLDDTARYTLRTMSAAFGVKMRTPYQWQHRRLLPPPDGFTATARWWYGSTLRLWHATRDLPTRRASWPREALAAARQNVIDVRGRPDSEARGEVISTVTEWLDDGAKWSPGQHEDTEELVVRVVDDFEGASDG